MTWKRSLARCLHRLINGFDRPGLVLAALADAVLRWIERHRK